MNYSESKVTKNTLQNKDILSNILQKKVSESPFISSQLCDVRTIATSQGIDYDSTFSELLFENEQGNLQISYQNLGFTIGTKFVVQPATYSHKKDKSNSKYKKERQHGLLLASETDVIFYRERLNNIFKQVKQGKKTPKYLSPKGSGKKAYLTAFNQLFINPKTKRFTLEKGQKIYIVEGEKKAIALCLLGIPAIAIGGINSIANKDIIHSYQYTDSKGKTTTRYIYDYKTATFIDGILQVISRFEPSEIVLLHDSDNFDNKNKFGRANAFFASVKACFYACQNANVSFSYAFHKCQIEKGIDDYIVANLAKTSEITSELQNLSNSDKKHFYSYEINDIEILDSVKRKFDESATHIINRFLSEKYDVIYEILASKQKRFMIDAPTGTGKTDTTFLIISELRRKFPNRRFINIVPTNALAKKNTHSFSTGENFHKTKLKICKIDQYTDYETKANLALNIDNYDVIICVANSFPFIKELVTDDTTIIFDEIHKCITQYNIAPLQDIQDIMNTNCNIVFMSGTPFASFTKEFNLDVVKFSRIENSDVKVNFIEILHEKDNVEKGIEKGFNHSTANDAYELAAMNIISTFEPKDKLYRLDFNDKARLERIKDYIDNLGIFTTYIVSADIKNEIDAKKRYAYDCLIESKPIKFENNKSIILLCTSFVYEGVNLVNESENIGQHFMFGESYVENAIQSWNRPRNAKELDVFFVTVNKPNAKPYYKTYKQHKQDALKYYANCEVAILREYKVFEQRKKQITEIDSDIEKYKQDTNDINKSLIDYLISEKKLLKECQKQYLANDISQLLTSDGRINRVKMVAMYEADKATYQTNQQKIEAIKKVYPNVEKKRVKASEIHTIFYDDISDAENEVFGEMAQKNSEIITNVQAIKKEQKEQKKELLKHMITDDTICTLALFCDSDVKFRRISEFKNYVYDVVSNCNSMILKSDNYQIFKDLHKPNLDDKDTFKLIEKLAKRLKPLQKHFNLTKEMLESTQFQNFMLLSDNHFKGYLLKLDTMQAIETNTPTIKGFLNRYMYSELYKYVESKIEYDTSENKVYQFNRKDIIQICKDVYEYEVKNSNGETFSKNEFAPIKFNDKHYFECMNTLFNLERKPTEKSYRYCFVGRNKYDKVQQMFDVEKAKNE